MPEAQRQNLAALTTLRFAAASMIVVYHTYLPFGIGHWLADRIMLVQAVSFFFVLSGFILTHVHSTLRAGERSRFFLARFARLWPLHLATFLATFALFSPGERTPGRSDAWAPALANLTLLQAWSPRRDYYFSYNGPSWSISVEATFYLLFPFLIRDLPRTWWWKLALAFGCLVAIVAYCNHHGAPDLNVMVYIHPLARLFEFVVGMTMALAWQRIHRRVGPSVAAGTVIELIAIAVVAWVMVHSLAWAQSARRWSFVGDAGALWLVHGGLPCLFFGAFIVVMALGRGLVSLALAARPLVVLGDISYAVYLVHHLLVRYYELHRTALAVVPPRVAYAIFWAVLLVAAHVTWTALEKPSRRLLMTLAPE